MPITRIIVLIIVTVVILCDTPRPVMGAASPVLTGLLPRGTPPGKATPCTRPPNPYRLIQKRNRSDEALLGGAVMQLELGAHMHAIGQFAKALYWFDRAAEKRLPEAYFNLAQLHHFGEGVPVDPITAERFYRRGAGLGDSESMINLALLLLNKPDQSKDLRLEIRQLLEEATRQNDPKAPLLLTSPLLQDPTAVNCSGH